LLSIFSKQLVDEYDFVGHLHTQGAPAGLDTPMSGSIQRFVLDNLLGNGDAPMADIILSHLVSQTEVGLVFPDDPVITDWPQDKPLVATLARRLGLAVDTLPDNQDTPLAAMFWARSEILRPLTTEISGWCSNLDAALPRDVSRFRIVAQLLPLLTEQAGLTIALTNLPGVTR
jgi:lipopolysaccharide biosynthesis protein